MRTLAVFLAPCLALAGPSIAQDKERQATTVEEMIEPCERVLNRTPGSLQELEAASHCFRVLYGVGQAARQTCRSLGWQLLPSPGVVSADPPSPLATLQAWVNWARQNPADWDIDFGPSAVAVIVRQFPCDS